jgi:hypothetical protein
VQFVVLAVVVVLVVLGILFGSAAARKRTQAMRDVALSLGLKFTATNDYTYDEQFPFLNKLCQGSNRYAFNILTGQFQRHPVALFDYHYETHSTDSKGRQQTHHHYFSFFILRHEKVFPELIIAREGWFGKVVQFFGFDDVDFESAEFSRKFEVRSKDKRFAYDICHAQMIEYLMRNDNLSIEMERDCVTFFFANRLDPSQIHYNLRRLVAVRDLFPEYLMKG